MFLGGHLDGERFICQSRALLPFSHNAIESGEELQKGPYVAETFPVHVEDSYVIIET
jgi:hypothetical protein